MKWRKFEKIAENIDAADMQIHENKLSAAIELGE